MPMSKILVAEDDILIADLLEDVLLAGGYQVCGIAGTVAEAIQLGERHKPDIAVIDLRLADGSGKEVAARLSRDRRLGILFATGNAQYPTIDLADGDAVLRKPFRPHDLVRALKIVEQIVDTGAASPPFPEGFEVIGPPGHRLDGHREARVERLLRQQAALAAFGSYAFREHDLAKILTEAARVCATSLDVPFCKVCKYRPEGNDLLVIAGFGWHSGVVGHAVDLADETSPQGRAFVTARPVIIRDLREAHTFALPPFYAQHGIVSTVNVIIQGEGLPYGVLEIGSPQQHDYDQHDIDFLTGFANVLAEAVATANRAQALQSTLDRMKALVAEKDRLLDDKNVLAQELQHRVRNNLQLVYGMLTVQSEKTAGQNERQALKAIARRVSALAHVYDHLLGSGMSRTIDFGAYLKTLAASLAEIETAQHGAIELVCETEPLVLDLDRATSLGVVVAELVSNSYEHAFPGGTGKINISLRAGNAETPAVLVVRDSGSGLDETGDSKRHGLGLVRRLMAQVGGTAEVRSDGGTAWSLRF